MVVAEPAADDGGIHRRLYGPASLSTVRCALPAVSPHGHPRLELFSDISCRRCYERRRQCRTCHKGILPQRNPANIIGTGECDKLYARIVDISTRRIRLWHRPGCDLVAVPGDPGFSDAIHARDSVRRFRITRVLQRYRLYRRRSLTSLVFPDTHFLRHSPGIYA